MAMTTEYLYEQSQAAGWAVLCGLLLLLICAAGLCLYLSRPKWFWGALYFVRDMVYGFSAVVVVCVAMPVLIIVVLLAAKQERRPR